MPKTVFVLMMAAHIGFVGGACSTAQFPRDVSESDFTPRADQCISAWLRSATTPKSQSHRPPGRCVIVRGYWVTVHPATDPLATVCRRRHRRIRSHTVQSSGPRRSADSDGDFGVVAWAAPAFRAVLVEAWQATDPGVFGLLSADRF
jgi:hypothetical protein